MWQCGFKLVSVTRKVLVLPSGFDSVRLLGSTMQNEVAVRDKPWMMDARGRIGLVMG